MFARCPATSASCWATSSAVAVPTSIRAWITFKVCSELARFCSAMTSRSCKSRAVNQVFATLVTTVSATTSWSHRLNTALAFAAS